MEKSYAVTVREDSEVEVWLCSFFNLSTRWRWVVNATPQLLYPLERPSAHCIGGWVGPRTVWMGAENLAPSGIRSPDRPARRHTN